MVRGNFADEFVFSGVFRTHVHGDDARVYGELHIGEAVAHHDGVGEVDVGEVGLGLQRHPDLGLTASAMLASKVRAAIDIMS